MKVFEVILKLQEFCESGLAELEVLDAEFNPVETLNLYTKTDWQTNETTQEVVINH